MTTRWQRPAVLLMVLAAVVGLAGCGDDGGTDSRDGAGGDSEPAPGQRFPDVVAVEARQEGETWTFEVTISSPYDTPERYADGWRIVGPDGTVYGEHELAHDHAGEQPFTRTQTRVRIPAGVPSVTVEGRDLQNGYGGTTKTVDLSGAAPSR